MQQAMEMENTFSDNSFTGYTETEGELKKAFYAFTKTFHTNMADKRVCPNEVFDRSFERWTQSTVSIKAVDLRTLSSACVTRPVANIDQLPTFWAYAWTIPPV